MPWEFINGTLIPLAILIAKQLHDALGQLKATQLRLDTLEQLVQEERAETERLTSLIRRWIAGRD